MVKTLLGHQLVENKIITEKQLDRALEYQKEKSSYGVPIRLGAALVELGFCTDEEISKTISAKTGYDFISLNNIDIDLMAANLIPLPLIKRYKAFAIGFEDEKLMVAMANPNDLLAIDDLSLITGYSIKPTVVSDAELAGVIERYGNTSTELVQNIDDDEDDNDNGVADNIDDAEKPAVLLVSQIINNGIKTGASDIHIEPQEKYLRIRYRIDGVLHEVMEQSRKLHASVISRIKVMSGMDIAERRVPQDGRATIKLDGKTVDLRVASLPSAYGERMTIRILNRNAKNITIEELGFPSKDNARYMETIHLPYGFLLVTGPTGSGKSTTLYATLAELNSTEKNLITLEDPIERRMDGLNQIQMNTKANMTFASGLRSILRSDPDIIMIGEIRDKETAQIAVESALTGHFVLSTLHTNDASSAVTRLGEMGVESFLTASSLAGVVAQRLVRVLCPRCKKPHTYSIDEILSIAPDFPVEKGENEVTIYEACGCLACNNTGYKGRRGVYEFLTVTEEIRQLILTHGSNHDIENVAISQGMTTLRADGLRKVRDGVTSMEELLRVIV